MLFLILALIGLLIFGLYMRRKLTRLPVGSVTMINGGIKCGKTLLGVSQSIEKYNHVLFVWKLKNFLHKIFPKCRKFKQSTEMPLLFSNIPIGSYMYNKKTKESVFTPYKYYRPLTTEHLKRKVRFPYKSVVFISEVSLVANSMCYKDTELNEELELFIKLFAHETRGGYVYYETQALGDNHYAIKRCLDTSYWIERLVNIPVLPFVIYKINRSRIQDSETFTTGHTEEENTTYTIFASKHYFKMYDRFCYSVFTDDLPLDNRPFMISTQKACDIPTFRTFKTLKGVKKNENENA